MKSKIISTTLVILGFVLGATALSALANWTTPTVPNEGETLPCTPPKCNTATPLNVGSTLQTKLGQLSLNFNGYGTYGLEVVNGIKLIDEEMLAATPKNPDRMVLTSDANGVGTWQPATGSGSSVSGIVSYTTPGTYTYSVPSGAKFARVTVVGSGIRTVSGSQSLYTGSCDGGLAIGSFTLGSSASMAITVGGNSSVTYGTQTITATAAQPLNINSGAGPCAYGAGLNGVLNGRGPYYGYGSGGNSVANSATGGIVVIEYY